MTAAEFARWLAAMKATGLARSDAAAGRLIGRSPDSIVIMKRRGTDRAVALACAAVLAGLQPYPDACRD